MTASDPTEVIAHLAGARPEPELPAATVQRVLKRGCGENSGVRFNPQATADLSLHVEKLLRDLGVATFNAARVAGRTTVRPEDVAAVLKPAPRASRKGAQERYIEWLEEVNEALAHALRDAGVPPVTLPPSPGIPQERAD